MTGRRPQRGLTLIEVLVAMAIFAIMAALGYGALNQTLASAEILSDRMARLQAIQGAVRRLEQDFMQLAPRPMRREFGQPMEPALGTAPMGIGLEMTRAGWSNPAGLPRGTLQRVQYFMEEDVLVRMHWNVLDRTVANEPVQVELLDDVERFDVRFMLDNGEWVDEWPPGLPAGAGGLRQRPRAVEILLALPNEGEITRLVEISP